MLTKALIKWGIYRMTHDTQKEYAGKGVAGSALGLGIAGTALALLNNNGNGLNLFGNNNSAPFGAPTRAGFDTGYIIENERRIGCMEAQLAGLKVAEEKDSRISFLQDQLSQANMFRYVDDKTCGVIKGQNLIAPSQIGDPYMGQRMVIATHPPVVEFERFNGPCNNNFRDYDRWY